MGCDRGDAQYLCLTQGTGVLLVGASEAATSAAALAVERALPSSCRDCLFVFKVPGLLNFRCLCSYI